MYNVDQTGVWLVFQLKRNDEISGLNVKKVSVFFSEEEATKFAALCEGYLVEATKFASPPIIKKKERTDGIGQKAQHTLAIEDVNI